MKWISVKERLPELNEPLTYFDDETGQQVVFKENAKATVWGYNPELGQFKAELGATGWAEIASSLINGTVEPTHWMPLPEPPKQ